MSRILFTQKSALELKVSLSNSFKILNSLFWEQIFSDHSDGLLIVNEPTEKHSFPIEPIKPQGQMKFYNKVATELGYKHWKELEIVSGKNNDLSIKDALFLNSDSELKSKITNLYLNEFASQYGAGHLTVIKHYKALLSLVLGGMVFNAEFSEKCVISDSNGKIVTLTANGLSFCRGNKLDAFVESGFGTLTPAIVPFIADTSSNSEVCKTLDLITDQDTDSYNSIKLLWSDTSVRRQGHGITITSNKVTLPISKDLPSNYSGLILFANVLFSFWNIYYITDNYSEFLRDVTSPTSKDALISQFKAYSLMR